MMSKLSWLGNVALRLMAGLTLFACTPDESVSIRFHHSNLCMAADEESNDKRYAVPNALGRLAPLSHPAPYREDQLTALVNHYITHPANPAWTDI